MKKHNKPSMDYIFKNVGENLEFIGDFESLYKNFQDPWEQSGKTGKISPYYKHSRKRLTDKLISINPVSLIEVGCGLGYTTNIIQNSLPPAIVVGMDISATAINKGSKKFSDLQFICGDIRSSSFNLHKKFEVVILNQLLWYILESFDNTIDNCFSLLEKEGKIIISQAFLKTPQRYGKDVCDGFDGLVKYLKNKDFSVEYSNLYVSNSLVHDDGLIVINIGEK